MNTSINETENLLFITLLQLIVMVGAARYMHTVFRRLGQPGVIGEIFAGLLLGPSLVGHFFPQASLALFGQHASAPITMISQIGLILLMFQIGLDFEFGHLSTRRNRRATIAVTIFSVGVPAIAAVPILGRILRKYGLTHTEIGVVAISAAAINDVIGWLLLSVVSAYAAATFSGAHLLFQLGGLLVFIVILWFILGVSGAMEVESRCGAVSRTAQDYSSRAPDSAAKRPFHLFEHLGTNARCQ